MFIYTYVRSISKFSHTYAMSISKNAGISKTNIKQHHRKRGYTNSQRSNGSSI